jgi:hypothetical protein
MAWCVMCLPCIILFSGLLSDPDGCNPDGVAAAADSSSRLLVHLFCNISESSFVGADEDDDNNPRFRIKWQIVAVMVSELGCDLHVSLSLDFRKVASCLVSRIGTTISPS